MFVPPLLLLSAGVIGLVFAIPNGTLGLAYFIVFTLAAVAGTLLVVPRGLVITVAQIPILFAIITFLTAWFTGSFADPENGGATATTSRRARLLTSAYPVVQQFPWLLVIMLTCVIIAGWRYLEISRAQQKYRTDQAREAKRRQRLDEAMVDSTSRVRRRLAESDRRVASREEDAHTNLGTARRPAADIIRDAEARRRARQQSHGNDWRQAQRPHQVQQAQATRPNKPTRPAQRLQPTRSSELSHDSGTPSPAFEARRPIERPHRPARTVQDNSRRQAGSSARMWGEKPSAPLQSFDASSASSNRHFSSEHHRTAEEWPPRHQRPRQSRNTDRSGGQHQDASSPRHRYRT